MSRRARALAFLVAALVCGVLAATMAVRYRSQLEARYGPLRPVVVATAELAAGEPIGEAGCTGSCTGTHLHFELREHGATIDPAPFFR